MRKIWCGVVLAGSDKSIVKNKEMVEKLAVLDLVEKQDGEAISLRLSSR